MLETTSTQEVGAVIPTVIVDDDPLARQRIRQLLLQSSDFDVIGEFDDGSSALEQVPSLQPTAMFLDVEMPGLSGFDVIEEFQRRDLPRPQIVMVTAYEKYAVNAFAVQAADYLVKPFDADRFSRTLERVRRNVRESSTSDLPVEDEESSGEGNCFPGRIAVKRNGRIQIIRTEDLDWIEASSNYVLLHSGGGEHVIRGTLSSFERRLDSRRFVRIHRSTVVNIDRILELLPLPGGHCTVVLRDGTYLRLHSAYRERLRTLIAGI